MGAGGRARAAREEELLGLLAGFPDGDAGSDRELSFSDLLVDAASARPSGAAADHAPPPPREGDHTSKTAPGKEAGPKQQATAPRRQRRQRSRGSCGGSGDGVLLNFYVPGLRLTRSMTAPRPGRAPPPSVPVTAAPAKAAAGPAGDRARLVTDSPKITCFELNHLPVIIYLTSTFNFHGYRFVPIYVHPD